MYFTLLHNNYMAFIAHMGNPFAQRHLVIGCGRTVLYCSADRSDSSSIQATRVCPGVWGCGSNRVPIFACGVGLPLCPAPVQIGFDRNRGLAACLAAGVFVPFDPAKVVKYAMTIIVLGCLSVAIVWGIFGDLGVVKHTVLACICAAVMLLIAHSPQHPLTWVFNMSWLRYLGLISYSLYLIHYFMLGAFHCIFSGRVYIGVTDFRDVLISLLALVCSLLLATLSRNYFEKPFIDYGRRLSYQ